MTTKDLSSGDLFQFRRQGHPKFYEANGTGGYREAGEYVEGQQQVIPPEERGDYVRDNDKPVKVLPRAWYDD